MNDILVDVDGVKEGEFKQVIYANRHNVKINPKTDRVARRTRTGELYLIVGIVDTSTLYTYGNKPKFHIHYLNTF